VSNATAAAPLASPAAQSLGSTRGGAGYREMDVIFAALHQDLADHLTRPSRYATARVCSSG
jgi:hypothetical protein